MSMDGNMDKLKYLVIFLFLLIGCSTIKIGSENHKATILYFEGGSGKIKRMGERGAENKLIVRADQYFYSAGIWLEYIPFNIPDRRQRLTDKHFNIITKKVSKLKTAGHKNIWLMGISNGAISVSNAGERQIQGVQGLILINPGAGGRLNDFKKITLPVLLITHELDGGLTGWSPDIFSYICPNSIRAQNSIFRGGITGTSKEARGSTQKYQHGLRGLEKEFADVVIDFIKTTPTLVNHKERASTV